VLCLLGDRDPSPTTVTSARTVMQRRSQLGLRYVMIFARGGAAFKHTISHLQLIDASNKPFFICCKTLHAFFCILISSWRSHEITELLCNYFSQAGLFGLTYYARNSTYMYAIVNRCLFYFPILFYFIFLLLCFSAVHLRQNIHKPLCVKNGISKCKHNVVCYSI